jgi:hypothetical protein
MFPTLSQKNEMTFINDYRTDVLEEKTQAPKKGNKNSDKISEKGDKNGDKNSDDERENVQWASIIFWWRRWRT